MFSRKYIFETKLTRYKRYFKNSILLVFLLFICQILFAFYLPFYGNKQTTKTTEQLFNKSLDSIVVFTGDIGRIKQGIEFSKKYQTAKLFISGVYRKNNVQTILRLLKKSSEKELDPNAIEIDRLARNTVENVIFTLNYLKSRPALKKIMIISHDYHLYRIESIVNKLLHLRTQKDENNDKMQILYYGIKSNLSKWKSLKIIYKEAYKVLKTYVFLILWDEFNDNNIP